MQISWFSNLSRIIHQRVFEKNLEDRINIVNWRAFTSDVDLGYLTYPMAAILDMQIGWFSNLSRIIQLETIHIIKLLKNNND